MSIFVKDTESKYGTYINGNRITTQQLNVGDTLKLGLGNVEYTLVFKPLRICCSGLSKQQRNVLKDICNRVGGELTDDPNICTHLVMVSISITSKVLVALARSVPFVTLKWLEDITSASIPPITKYCPPLSDSPVMKLWNEQAFQGNPHRRTLFQDLAFVIFEPSQLENYKPAILSAGGIVYGSSSLCLERNCECNAGHPWKDVEQVYVVDSNHLPVLSGDFIVVAAEQIAKSILSCDRSVFQAQVKKPNARIPSSQLEQPTVTKSMTRQESRILLSEQASTTPRIAKNSSLGSIHTPNPNLSFIPSYIKETPIHCLRQGPQTPCAVDEVREEDPSTHAALPSIRSKKAIEERYLDSAPSFSTLRAVRELKEGANSKRNSSLHVMDELLFNPDVGQESMKDTQQSNQIPHLKDTDSLTNDDSRQMVTFSAKTQAQSLPNGSQPKMSVDDFMDLLMDMGPQTELAPTSESEPLPSIRKSESSRTKLRETLTCIEEEIVEETIEKVPEDIEMIALNPTEMEPVVPDPQKSRIEENPSTYGSAALLNEPAIEEAQTARLHPYVKPIPIVQPQVLLEASEIHVRVVVTPLLVSNRDKRKQESKPNGYRNGVLVPNFKRFKSKTLAAPRMISCLPKSEFHIETSIVSEY
jgi:hypothetical protein